MQSEGANSVEQARWSNADLLFLAKAQKNFVLWFGLALILHVISYWFRPVLFIGSIGLMIVVYDLARASHVVQPGLYAFGTLIPIVSLLIFLSLNMSATQTLAEHDFKVGVFGIKPGDLDKLRNAESLGEGNRKRPLGSSV
jgi:hypothetical protein